MVDIIGKTLTTAYDPKERKASPSFNGKILHLDLSNGKMSVEEPTEKFYRTYIGGRGFILHYLLSTMPAGTDPLSPDNVLVFAPGVLSGTTLPGTGRHSVGAKSPLTNALASGEAGGWWGAELKRAGFDAIVIRGRAETPVYLWIKDGAVEIRDASHLWGKLTNDAQEMIRQELGDDKIRIAQIGPAGENQVRIACILNNANRAAGRSGLGAVMGSKNLKAIAVRGSTTLGMADRNLMLTVTKWIGGNYQDLMGWAVAAGTSGSVNFCHATGATPINNFRDPVFEGVENLDATQMFPLMLKERDTCNVCPVHCKLVVEYDQPGDPRKIKAAYGGPEYETIGGMGPMCRVKDVVAVAKANELCAAYGLDTISTGGTIAFTMECVEKGLLRKDEGYDFLPEFGDGDALIESIHRIANRHGIGDLMAEGSARMGKKLGPAADDMVVVTRGQELPMHDPRYKNAYGLGYALSATGADHMANMDDTFANNPGSDVCARLRELGFETPLPLFGLPETKIKAFATELAYKNFLDSAVICHFYPYEYKHVVDALNAATGWDVTRDEIVEIGTRVIHMARLFLMREGFTSQDDRLPPRAFQAHSSGPIAGKALTPQELNAALKTYYQLMGWSPEGVPGKETVGHYGLQHFAEGALP